MKSKDLVQRNESDFEYALRTLRCPLCAEKISKDGDILTCRNCKQDFKKVGRIGK